MYESCEKLLELKIAPFPGCCLQLLVLVIVQPAEAKLELVQPLGPG